MTLMSSLLLLIFSIFSSVVSAESIDTASVVADQTHAIPKVGPDWNDALKKDLYKGSPSGVGDRIMALILDESPASLFGIVKENLNSDFSKKAPIIAQQCKQLNPDLPWAQITCASKSVKATLKKFKWPNTTSSCRAHAEAFREVFNELGIPRSEVGAYDATTTVGGHVVNRVTLTDRNGKTYSYILDVDWAPDQIFPLGELTKEFHQINKNLPDVRFENPKYAFQASDQTGKFCSKKSFKNNLEDLWKALNFSSAEH